MGRILLKHANYLGFSQIEKVKNDPTLNKKSDHF